MLTGPELTEIRAAQRTFEGAYVRTALGQFSFALVVLKIFTAEFYSIGALFAVYGSGVLFASLYRRMLGNRQFFDEVDDGGASRSRFPHQWQRGRSADCAEPGGVPVAAGADF